MVQIKSVALILAAAAAVIAQPHYEFVHTQYAVGSRDAMTMVQSGPGRTTKFLIGPGISHIGTDSAISPNSHYVLVPNDLHMHRNLQVPQPVENTIHLEGHPGEIHYVVAEHFGPFTHHTHRTDTETVNTVTSLHGGGVTKFVIPHQGPLTSLILNRHPYGRPRRTTLPDHPGQH